MGAAAKPPLPFSADRPIAPARTMEGLVRPGLRDLLALATRPEVLSFSIGLPAGDLLPCEVIAEAAAELLGEGPRPVQYGLPSSELKARIVELMALRGVVCTPEEVLLTTGAQQGTDLLARVLIEPGSTALVEEVVYDGVQMVLWPLKPKVVALPTDPGTGLDLDALERSLTRAERPSFLYVVPEGHNPLGVSLSLPARIRLVEIAARFGVPVIEDDAYGHLTYDAPPAPALASLDRRRVIYLGSFSKVLAPGLRVGWIVAPRELMPTLAALKHASDIDTTSLGQRIVERVLERGDFQDHLARLRKEYARRRDAMVSSLIRSMPAGVRWWRPTAGFFIWAELPPGFDSAELLKRAVETEQVAFSPGRVFAVGDCRRGRSGMRLCFAPQSPERIHEGIARLSRVIARELEPMAEPALSAG